MLRNNLLTITPRRAKKHQRSTINDAKEFPLYSIAEVANSLRMAPSVLTSWTLPKLQHGKKSETFDPLIRLPESHSGEGRLSFFNVIEVHVLLGMRRDHRIPMLEIRRAVHGLRDTTDSAHPLADYDFKTKGQHVFIEMLGSVLDLSQGRQHIILDVLDKYLQRIRRDQSGTAFRLTPIAPGMPSNAEPVMIDMRFASGKLVILNTGIRASVVEGRFKAGHTVEKLAHDYNLSVSQIQGALDYLKEAAA